LNNVIHTMSVPTSEMYCIHFLRLAEIRRVNIDHVLVFNNNSNNNKQQYTKLLEMSVKVQLGIRAVKTSSVRNGLHSLNSVFLF
jgi:hypothetical protein